MNDLPALDTLTAALNRLPGIGRRTAERMAMALVRDRRGLMRLLAGALTEADRTLTCCERCGSVTPTERNPCDLCVRPRRDAHVLCVVDSASDVLKIESAGGFAGRYHALMGRLPALREDAAGRIRCLLRRIEEERFEEVVIALGGDVEGDATAVWLKELLAPTGAKVSRIAFGLPAGGALEHADSTTLARALAGRRGF